MAKHCFHPTGISFMTNPPLHEMKCCFCALTTEDHPHYGADPSHGPHAPKTFYYRIGADVIEQECAARARLEYNMMKAADEAYGNEVKRG